MVLCGGLPMSELTAVDQVVTLSVREREMIAEWSAPGSINVETGEEDAPPGRGKFLIKVGGHPGIPVDVVMTEDEVPVNNTNQKWANSTTPSVAAQRVPSEATVR